MKKYPPAVVVDDNDNVIGSAMLKEVWKKGLFHRIVLVMVRDKAGRLLLQKRSKNMLLHPGCWDHSAAGHVDEGFTYEQAARGELQEELGVTEDVQLTEVAYHKSKETLGDRKLNRFYKMYTVVLDAKTEFAIGEYEVSEVRWFTPKEAKKLVAEHPDQVTEGLADDIKKYF